VLYENKIFKMWYCYEIQVGKYKIGYAESKNGINWIRKDNKANIACGIKNSWDGEMIAYPYVIKYKKKKFMFYNGNMYGREGVGLAVEENS